MQPTSSDEEKAAQALEKALCTDVNCDKDGLVVHRFNVTQVVAQAIAQTRSQTWEKIVSIMDAEMEDGWWEEIWQNDWDRNEIVEETLSIKRRAILSAAKADGCELGK